MNCVLLIEQQGQQNAVKISIEESQSICIGRSWHSDVIVTDKYVDAQHLKISANDEQFEIEDLGSENGTRLEKKPVKGRIPYEFGSDIVVGETTLRLVDVNSTVEPAIKHDRAFRLFHKVGRVRSMILSTFLAFCSILAMMNWGVAEHSTTQEFLGGAAMVFGVFLVWSLLAGCARIIFRQKALFSLHWVFICSLFSFTVIMSLPANIAKFNFHSSFVNNTIDHFSGVVILLLWVYGALTLICKMRAGSKLLTAFSLAALVLFSDLIMPMLAPKHERWSQSTTVTHTGQPPEFHFSKTTTIDTHIAKTEKLFDKLK